MDKTNFLKELKITKYNRLKVILNRIGYLTPIEKLNIHKYEALEDFPSRLKNWFH